MKLFIIWAQRSPDMKILMSELKNHSHEVLYWVGCPEVEQYKPPETIFHSYIGAEKGMPAKGINISEFLPPGEEIIKKLYRVESLILSMMNRFSEFEKEGIEKRKRRYYELLRYWLGVLKKYQPELIIFPNAPHFVYDYLIYELAKLLNIQTIAFDDTRISGRLLFFNDLWEGSNLLREKLRINAGKKFNIEDLSSDIRDYYKPLADKNYKSTPFYINEYKKKYSILYWLFAEPKIRQSIKDFTIFKKAVIYFWKMIQQKKMAIFLKPLIHLSYLFRPNLKKEYLSVQSSPDLSRPFIYFPLQVQPERTTSPQGDMFADQILALEILSASIPEDWTIYVKEHPIQWLHFGFEFSSYRYRGYYRKIASIKNVKLIPKNINSYDLIDRSKAVALVTGSAAWEAVLRSKPAIIFGYVWYENCQGILKVNNAESCRAAIQKIIDGFKVKQDRVINFLKSLEQATIRGYISKAAGKVSRLSLEERMVNISDLLLSEIEKYSKISK